MGNQGTITVFYHPEEMGFYEIVMILLESGWNLNDFGEITYQILNTDTPDELYRIDLSKQEQVLKTIKELEQEGKTIGLVMMWRDTEIGCTLLRLKKGEVSFALNVNRKRSSTMHRWTDVTWYIDLLVPILTSHGIKISAMKWTEGT
jgi:hypothetical protein